MAFRHGIKPQVIVTDRDIACLNALDKVFPTTHSLICRWHMNKDVEARIQREGGEYKQVYQSDIGGYVNSEKCEEVKKAYFHALDSPTESDFEERASQLQTRYPRFASYFSKEWWPYRERCVAAWTNKVMHFGEQTTSRLEGSHSVIKGWLDSSQCDLLSLFESLLLCWQNQHNEYRKVMGASLNRTTAVTTPFFQSCIRRIHQYPLVQTKKLLDEVRQAIQNNATDALGACTGYYRQVFGMPCKHELYSKWIAKPQGVLLPTEFNTHWWIDREEAPTYTPDPRDPATRPRRQFNRRVSHQAGHGIKSTRREHLASEQVNRNVNTPPAMATTTNPHTFKPIVPSTLSRQWNAAGITPSVLQPKTQPQLPALTQTVTPQHQSQAEQQQWQLPPPPLLPQQHAMPIHQHQQQQPPHQHATPIQYQLQQPPQQYAVPVHQHQLQQGQPYQHQGNDNEPPAWLPARQYGYAGNRPW